MPRAALATAILVASSFTLNASDRAGEREGGRRAMRRWLLVTIGLGVAFLVNQVAEYATLDFGADDHPYGSVFWLLTGLHGAHVTAGLAAMGAAPRPRRAGADRRGGGALGQRGVAVLAPRRRHLAVPVLHHLGAPMRPGRALLAGPAVAAAVVGIASFAGASAGRPGRGPRRGALPHAVRGVPRHRRCGRRPAWPDPARRGPGGRRLRAAHRPDADGRAEHAGPPGTGALHRGGDRRPRRLRRRVRRRAATSPTSTPTPAMSPAAVSCSASTARRATWRPAPGRRSAGAVTHRR